jgi:signal transduction histidine kinase
LQRQKLLIEDILCAGLLESGTAGYSFKQVELHELLRKVISEYEVSIRKKCIRLTLNDTFQDQNALCWIYADIQAMVRVFSNLLSNAVKFTSFKGTIRIDVIENDNEIIVSIADNGMGIAQEDLPFIFQRFYRGQNAVTHEIQGTGLGLYIIQSIVEKHGGRIQVLSKPGKGSTFKVILPRNIS